MSKKLQKYWYQQGVKAGKTEGWMNLEETLAETLRDHPSFARDPQELVQTDIDGWEETDHFQVFYGSKMSGDARDENGELDIDAYQDHKSEFWEGYLTGRRAIGKDIYKLARELIAKKRPVGKKSKTMAKKKKRVLLGSVRGLRR